MNIFIIFSGHISEISLHCRYERFISIESEQKLRFGYMSCSIWKRVDIFVYQTNAKKRSIMCLLSKLFNVDPLT